MRGKILQNNLYKKITALLLIILIFNSAVYLNLREKRFDKNNHIANAQALSIYHDSKKIQGVADKIISWAKTEHGISQNKSLIEDGLSNIAGTSHSDWYVIGIKRISAVENTPLYATSLKQAIEHIINMANSPGQSFSSISGKEEKLGSANVTDMFRNILTLSVLGENPNSFKVSATGNTINLINDFVYNRKIYVSTTNKLINWLTWSLVVIDSKQYSVPSNASFTREKLITEILKLQKPSGGFALSLSKTFTASDPDISAMVIQALAPYYNSEKTYSYIRAIDNKQMTKTIRQVIDEALVTLSKTQLPSGDYEAQWSSTKSRNVETVAQVALALCCLGIDPQKDFRFIKNGKSLIDGILLYQNIDGGFSHEYPKSASKSMTSSQVLYTLSAVLRQQKGMRTLYDFREEQSITLKNKINMLKQKISQISAQTSKEQLNILLKDYYSIVDNERMYVYNYPVLAKEISSRQSSASNNRSSKSDSITSLNPDSDFDNTSFSLDSQTNESDAKSTYDTVSAGDNSLQISTGSSIENSIDGDNQTKSKDKDFLKIAITIVIFLIVMVIAWSYFGKKKNEKAEK